MGGVPLACEGVPFPRGGPPLAERYFVRPVARAAATGTRRRLHVIRADMTMMSEMPFPPTATVSRTEKRNFRA